MFVFFDFLSLYIFILTVILNDFNKKYEYFTRNSLSPSFQCKCRAAVKKGIKNPIEQLMPVNGILYFFVIGLRYTDAPCGHSLTALTGFPPNSGYIRLRRKS